MVTTTLTANVHEVKSVTPAWYQSERYAYCEQRNTAEKERSVVGSLVLAITGRK